MPQSVARAVAKPVGVAVTAGRQPGGLLEDAAECGRVAVADTMADLANRVIRRFQQAYRLLDASVLKVGLRPAAGGGREPAGQGPLPQPEPGQVTGLLD